MTGRRRPRWSYASGSSAKAQDDFRTKSSSDGMIFPEKDIADARDHLIHGYDLIDHRILWDAVHSDIPRLIEAIDELSLPRSPRSNRHHVGVPEHRPLDNSREGISRLLRHA
jgi:hypothetical protein